MVRVNSEKKCDKYKFDLEFDFKELAIVKDLKNLSVFLCGAVFESEVESVCGAKYSRIGKFSRWGFNPGSIDFGDGKVKIRVPRILDTKTNSFYKLKTYDKLKAADSLDEGTFSKILYGISTRDYSRVIETISGQFGFTKSSISRKFLKIAALKLDELNSRDLSNLDLVAIFLDGKRFSKSGLILALGVDITGRKHYLGFIESSSEKTSVVKDFFSNLEGRGLSIEENILFIVDGAKGPLKAIQEHFADRAFIQRCQWHKRENVVGYLSQEDAPQYRRELQLAYEQPTYDEAKSALMKIHKKLLLRNRSAANSLMEGLEETLTLHRLGVFPRLGRSFKTTNVLEAVNRQVQKYSGRVTRWSTSLQIQARTASILIEQEHRLKKVCGHKFLHELREKMKKTKVNKLAA
jgi:transposase-like protein